MCNLPPVLRREREAWTCRKSPSGFSARILQSAARIIRLPVANEFRTCSLRSVFVHVHAAAKNDLTLFAASAANSARLFLTVCCLPFSEESGRLFVVWINKDVLFCLCSYTTRKRKRWKMHKKTRHMPRKCTKYALTKNTQYDTIAIHTVILCLFPDSSSNMVILP